MEIVDFLLKAYFWVSPNSSLHDCTTYSSSLYIFAGLLPTLFQTLRSQGLGHPYSRRMDRPSQRKHKVGQAVAKVPKV